MRQVPLFVGEAPGSGYAPELASPLFPYPGGSAGRRLQQLTGLGRAAYVRETVRLNLLAWYPGERWPHFEAGLAACNIVRGSLPANRLTVLVGKRVELAFATAGIGRRVALTEVEVVPGLAYWAHERGCVLWLPHPSGRNRWYNDAKNIGATRDTLRHLMWEWRP